MTRQNATAMIPVRDPLPIVLELMRARATSVLGEHTDEAWLYAVGDSAVPSERIVLAAHNLAVI